MLEHASIEKDVRLLYETEPLKCQLCSASLQKLSSEQRQIHHERHFSDHSDFAVSSSAHPPPTARRQSPNTNAKLQSLPQKGEESSLKQNVFWYPFQSTTPPDNFTPGLVQVLKHALIKTHAKGITTHAALCYEGATHIVSEFWDRGWGCGYRNFLMACAALMEQSTQPLYFPLLDDPIPPGIRNLQYWIEDAWANGFDRQGAEELRHKLVGTKKWIGTAELYTAFVSRGIPARLIDFPGSQRGHRAVTEWVVNYFSPQISNNRPSNAFEALKSARPVTCTDLMPLILQHAGHSRTVVGYEVNKKGDPNLLIFDPSIRPSKELRRAALAKYAPPSRASKAANGPSSFLQRVLRPHPPRADLENRKRQAPDIEFDADGRQMKRPKGGSKGLSSDGNLNVVDDDDAEDVSQGTLDPTKVLSFFRVNQNRLRKNDRYQILYFPLGPPLEQKERWARRVVTSERVE